jgi:thymidylate kinase
MNNGKIVYLDRYLADNLTSQENRNIQITWPGAIGDITSVSILPDVNILDQSVYQKPQ